MEGGSGVSSAEPAGAQGLVAGLQRLRPGMQFEVHPLTSNGCSWVLLARGFAPSTSEEFNHLWNEHPAEQPCGSIMGKEVVFPRYSQAYGFDYAFTGQVASALPLAQSPPLIQTLLTELASVEPCAAMNSVLVNWYDASSKHYIGAHADNEVRLVPAALCLSPLELT